MRTSGIHKNLLQLMIFVRLQDTKMILFLYGTYMVWYLFLYGTGVQTEKAIKMILFTIAPKRK